MAAKVPRNFRLLEELEKGEKGQGAGELTLSGLSISGRGADGDGDAAEACSYGLEDPEDLLMSNWNGTILGPPHVCPPRTSLPPTPPAIPQAELTPSRSPQSVHENRIYSVRMHCGPNYPDEPPTLQFVSQVNLPCVSPRNGAVDPKQLPCLAAWQRTNTMETALIELRRWVVPFRLRFPLRVFFSLPCWPACVSLCGSTGPSSQLPG